MHTRTVDLTKEKLLLGDFGTRTSRMAAMLGLLGLAATAILAFMGGGERFFQSWLLSFVYFLSISLGALFFVLIQHVTSSGWSVVVRRLAEGIAANLPWLFFFSLPLLFGMDKLYHWADAEHVAHDALLQWKQPYLNLPFFYIRLVIYFAAWTLLSRGYLRSSVRQDSTGDIETSRRMKRWSAPSLVIFGFTLTFASVDFLMSLDAHWFSTMFGVYYFAGSVVGFFAFLPLLSGMLQRKGFLRRSISIEHYHDMGKLIFAFLVFWAYIAFSQYMLIWYSNIPEETTWFLRRQTGSWETWSWFLLAGHFFLPFVGLLSATPKRRGRYLMPFALWVLVMHWVDLYYIIMPEFTAAGSLGFHLLDLTTFLGIGGIWMALLMRTLGKQSLIPLKDPRLAESLAFENA
ncbi:quinol:cytochrome C oxidoreductase [bacterium]|nr:quinol:cytochrome C oxidoreductase [bacterium]